MQAMTNDADRKPQVLPSSDSRSGGKNIIYEKNYANIFIKYLSILYL